MKLVREGMERLQSLVRRKAETVTTKVAREGAEKVGKEGAEKVARGFADEVLAVSNTARKLAQVKADPEIAGMAFKVAAEQGGLKGGHLSKQVMEDAAGQRWMFKAVPKGEEYRALGDKAGGDILRAIGISTPQVHLTTQVMDGRPQFGTIQKLVDHSGQKLPSDAAQLSRQQLDDLTEAHVGRWLISDHDGKVENFLVRKGGGVETIDLGQMYRFFPEDSLDRLYQPNAKKPIFNEMWDDYVAGKVDLNFQKGLERVAKVEALPDDEFAKLLRPYAEARYAQEGAIPTMKTVDEFMQSALNRKKNLRDDMLGFYDSLAKERGLSGVEEALGTYAAQHADDIRRVGLQPVQKLHPRVAEAFAQSRANAARYKEETIQVLTEKFGSRTVAEQKYKAIYEKVRKDMFIAANYPNSALTTAIKEGRIRSLYDFPVKDQIKSKGAGYVAGRHFADLRLGLHGDNPLYVTVGGNQKYAKDIAKYGDTMMRYKDAELAGKVLYSDGNHNFYAKNMLNAKSQFEKQRFTYFDVPHLTVNRIVKEGLDPSEASHLIEGIVYGGIDPRTMGEAIKPLRAEASKDILLEAAKEAGLSVLP